jgi:DNA-binding NarL/FixJ family response regulator
MQTSTGYSENQVLVPTCSQSKAKQIAKMRRQGLKYKTIAYKLGNSETTVMRWHRIIEKYGITAFAEDGDE